MLSALVLTACSDNQKEESPTASRPRINVQDSLAIVAFYHSMKCAEWKGDFHWDLKDYETWGGIKGSLDVEKNEYRITKIEVPQASKFLPGGYSLPPELGNLTELRELIVYGDKRASGGIPPEIFNCPLTVLYIVDCETPHGGFTGTIPKEIGKVANTLKYLTISNTSIGGEIPEEIGTLVNLESRACLDGNRFEGKVPIYFQNLPYGATLAYNFFEEMDWRYFTEDKGYVPELIYNHLHGEIPDEVLSTERWKHTWAALYNQEGGYGYDAKYFTDCYH